MVILSRLPEWWLLNIACMRTGKSPHRNTCMDFVPNGLSPSSETDIRLLKMCSPKAGADLRVGDEEGDAPNPVHDSMCVVSASHSRFLRVYP